MKKRIITSTTQITHQIINEIYTTENNKELVPEIVSVCSAIPINELEAIFQRLIKHGSAHELANILEGAARFTFKVDYTLPCPAVFRNNIHVARLELSEEQAA